MGQQAKLRRNRRELLREQHARSRALNEQASAPETQARLAALHDEECGRLKDGAKYDQYRALSAAGWKQREQNNDGIGTWDHRARKMRIIHSVARELDGQVWGHVSLSNKANTMPTWYEVRNAGWLLYPGKFGIVVVAPESRHVNIANVAHVWFCLTAPSCPDFSHSSDGFNSI
jgi:hypothetical protein